MVPLITKVASFPVYVTTSYFLEGCNVDKFCKCLCCCRHHLFMSYHGNHVGRIYCHHFILITQILCQKVHNKLKNTMTWCCFKISKFWVNDQNQKKFYIVMITLHYVYKTMEAIYPPPPPPPPSPPHTHTHCTLRFLFRGNVNFYIGCIFLVQPPSSAYVLYGCPPNETN